MPFDCVLTEQDGNTNLAVTGTVRVKDTTAVITCTIEVNLPFFADIVDVKEEILQVWAVVLG